jgi:hypothetical protein
MDSSGYQKRLEGGVSTPEVSFRCAKCLFQQAPIQGRCYRLTLGNGQEVAINGGADGFTKPSFRINRFCPSGK